MAALLAAALAPQSDDVVKKDACWGLNVNLAGYPVRERVWVDILYSILWQLIDVIEPIT